MTDDVIIPTLPGSYQNPDQKYQPNDKLILKQKHLDVLHKLKNRYYLYNDFVPGTKPAILVGEFLNEFRDILHPYYEQTIEECK